MKYTKLFFSYLIFVLILSSCNNRNRNIPQQLTNAGRISPNAGLRSPLGVPVGAQGPTIHLRSTPNTIMDQSFTGIAFDITPNANIGLLRYSGPVRLSGVLQSVGQGSIPFTCTNAQLTVGNINANCAIGNGNVNLQIILFSAKIATESYSVESVLIN